MTIKCLYVFGFEFGKTTNVLIPQDILAGILFQHYELWFRVRTSFKILSRSDQHFVDFEGL